MDKKDYITNKAFCPLPFTGMYVHTNGLVRNCVVARENIGDLKTNSIHDIVNGNKNTEIKTSMLAGKMHASCNACYDLEANKNSFDVISSRVYYLKELKSVPMDTYSTANFNLYHTDIRWTNSCNFACVYCGPRDSSTWAKELNIYDNTPNQQRTDELREYVLAHAHQLKNVYLAGGEPLLMKENEQFLKHLLKVNPDVQLRVNTNLSKTQTRVFDLVCEFKNVHWTVSVDTIEDQFEYVRHGGRWVDFIENLNKINTLGHKISFNMLWFVLNYLTIFDCVDYLKQQGFHNNSFIIGPIVDPKALDVRNLPDKLLNTARQILTERISAKPGFLLEESYSNMLNYINTPFDGDLKQSLAHIDSINKRRGVDSSQMFGNLYKALSDV